MIDYKMQNFIFVKPKGGVEDAWRRLFDLGVGVELKPLPSTREILQLAKQERDNNTKSQ
jgi:hypothetical protein